jgi:predicted PurR-regulated permease PerM
VLVKRPNGEDMLEFLRARAERRYALAITDARPDSIDNIRRSASQVATIGIFVLMLGAALYFCRPLLLPVVTAMVMGATLAPLVKRASKAGIPPWVTSLVIAMLLVAAVALGVTLMAAPVAEWVGRAPEIGEIIRQKLYVFDRPLAAWRELQQALHPSTGNTVAVENSELTVLAPVVGFVTPALAQVVLFLATLVFFLAVQGDFRRYMVSLFGDRDAKLRFLRIANDVEHNLGSYVAVVSVINVVLGILVAIGAWAFGFPNPLILGALATVFNYVPYIGPAVMAIVLFASGLVVFPTLTYALLPPACFVALATLEGHLITPTILGRQLTLNPLAIFLALAFWTWLWGPMGAFLAVPLSIIAFVISYHLVPGDEPKLPE